MYGEDLFNLSGFIDDGFVVVKKSLPRVTNIFPLFSSTSYVILGFILGL